MDRSNCAYPWVHDYRCFGVGPCHCNCSTLCCLYCLVPAELKISPNQQHTLGAGWPGQMSPQNPTSLTKHWSRVPTMYTGLASSRLCTPPYFKYRISAQLKSHEACDVLLTGATRKIRRSMSYWADLGCSHLRSHCFQCCTHCHLHCMQSTHHWWPEQKN